MRQPSKASRKQEQKKLGPLSQIIIQPRTKSRYQESFKQFCKFHELAEGFIGADTQRVDVLAAEYIEFLQEEGLPKSDASYGLAAIQFFRPLTKDHVVWFWKLVKTWNQVQLWNQVELPTTATPLSPELLFSLAGQCFNWKQPRMGWLLVVASFLGTSESFNLRRKEVDSLPQLLLKKPCSSHDPARACSQRTHCPN